MKSKRFDLAGRRGKIDPAIWVFLFYIVGFIYLYSKASSIIAPLTFGWYLSLIIDVPARFLKRIRFISHKVAVIISSIVMFGLILFCMISLIPIALKQGTEVIELLTNSVQNMKLPDFITKLGVSGEVSDLIKDSSGTVVNMIATVGQSVISFLLSNLPSMLTGSAIFFVTAAYFTSVTPVLKRNVWRFFPKSTRKKSITFVGEFYNEIRHFVGGQMVIASIIGVFVGVGMLIFGIPSALFLGFLTGITNFIPYLGSIIAMIPAVLIGFTAKGPVGAITALAILLVSSQLEAWVLSPKIQGQRMKINWFIILIGIFLFGAFFGILGILLSIPIMVFLRKFWVEYVQEMFNKL